MRLLPGAPYPLGATFDGAGVNFAITSAHATQVDLCLFDAASDATESIRLVLPGRTDHVWHGYLPGGRPGQLYAYRVDGPWDPDRGLRFNRAKLLLDPYARAIGRVPSWHPSLFAFAPGSEGAGPIDSSDSAAHAALGVVAHNDFAWNGDQPPGVPWHETAIYELHVKGMTALHPDVPDALRGTYLGLTHPSVIDHLKRLNMTAVELMPVHFHVDEQALVRRGLTNYWGYSTLGYFAPDPRFACASDPLDVIAEFKTMVRALHAAGLEVILDVVYNHTAEGDHLGPNLCFRGIDNASYYRLEPDRPSRYRDFTGTGNTLDTRSPQTLQLVMDSLRYWVSEMHVDGFRFDLAAALARGEHDFEPHSAFLEVIGQDPVLSRVKLIAEPWDAAPGGYQVGGFGAGWSEWNGHYRDAIRRFWRADPGMLPELATRLAGSADLYAPVGRQPDASINFVTSHDGFTLADLVAFEQKHNATNGEDNRDGESNNLSWNCGVEGPTDDEVVLALRRRQRRNFLATLAVSQGVPMLSGGDEFGRSQAGNNNAYCHDSPLSWTHWDRSQEARDFLEFVRALFAIRRANPVLRRRTFLAGKRPEGTDVLWLRPDGQELDNGDWTNGLRTMAMLLDGNGILESDPEGRQIVGASLFVVFNGAEAAVECRLPGGDGTWTRLADTAEPRGVAVTIACGGVAIVGARSVSIWRLGLTTNATRE